VADELARRKAELLALEDSFADEFGDSLDDTNDDDALGWSEASAVRQSTGASLRSGLRSGAGASSGLGLRGSGGAFGHAADPRRYAQDAAAVPASVEVPAASVPAAHDSLANVLRGSGNRSGPVPTRALSDKAAAAAAVARSGGAGPSSAPGTAEEESDETLFGTQRFHQAVAVSTETANPAMQSDAAERGGLGARRRGSAGVAGASAEALASLLQWAAAEEEGGGAQAAPPGGRPGAAARALPPPSPHRAAASAAEALRPAALLAPADPFGDLAHGIDDAAAFAEAAAPSPYLESNGGPGSKGSNGDDSLELVFNPVLNAYYDPKSGRFYHLKDDHGNPEPPL
jgi:hypothetical protein